MSVERLFWPGFRRWTLFFQDQRFFSGQEVGQNSVQRQKKGVQRQKKGVERFFWKLCYFALNRRNLAFLGERGWTTVTEVTIFSRITVGIDFGQKILKKSSKIQILVKNPQKMSVFGQKSSKNVSNWPQIFWSKILKKRQIWSKILKIWQFLTKKPQKMTVFGQKFTKIIKKRE